MAQVTARLRLPRFGAALLAASLVAAAPLPSAGQPTKEDQAVAQKLFLEGRDALARGENEAACVKFRSSLALFPVTNTLANVAQCEEREGKLLEALRTWQKIVPEFAPGDERLGVAKERMAALEARIPQLTLVLSAEVPPDAAILVDGSAVDRAALLAPLKLAAGEHAIVVQAAGRSEQRLTVTLAEGDRKDLRLTPGPSAATAPTQTASAKGPTAPTSTVTAAPQKVPEPDSRRTAAFVSGGVGLAGLVAAAITGGLIVAKDGDIQKGCQDIGSGKKSCSPESLRLIQDVQPLMIVNAVAWGVGLVGVGLGTVLFVTGRRSDSARAALSPVVLPGGGGAAITGNF